MSGLEVTPATIIDPDVSEGTDLPDGKAHAFKREDIEAFKGTGIAITALCGHRQPVEDFMPTAKGCERCLDILRTIKAGHPGQN